MLVLATLTEALDLRSEAGSDKLRLNTRRRKRQDNLSPIFEDRVVLVALQNKNACNPVLRASANTIIEEMEM